MGKLLKLFNRICHIFIIYFLCMEYILLPAKQEFYIGLIALNFRAIRNFHYSPKFHSS